MELLTSPEFLVLAMFASTIMVLLAGFQVAFTLAGMGILFAMIGYGAGIIDLPFLKAFPQRILDIMSSQVLLAVPLFVFMGVMLERSRVAEDMLENMARLFRSRPGGMAFSVTIVGALLAASTGIVGATVVTMGLLSLPAMMRHGYSNSFACGTIAASGTLGQIIPPSIVLVLLGDQLSTAYQTALNERGDFSGGSVSANDLFAGALVPGFILVGMYLVYQFIYSRMLPENAPAIRDEEGEEATEVSLQDLLMALFPPIALIIAVLGSILGGLATPTEAASVGAVGAVMLAAYRLVPHGSERGQRVHLYLGASVASMAGLLLLSSLFDLRMNLNVLSLVNIMAFSVAVILTGTLFWGIAAGFKVTFEVMEKDGTSILASVSRSTLMISSMVFIILIGASMFSLVVRGYGGDEMIENFLKELPGGTAGAVLTVMLVIFLLGFFLDFLEIMFIAVPIIGPILLQMDIAPGVPMNPVWLGILLALNLQTSFLTPPFGFSLFYLRGVAPPAVKTMEIYRGVLPFVGLQILTMLLIWFYPGLATALPAYLYGG